ncbi:hypothetical protein Leryth_009176 [Lithospermum erythrorhizon]|uniref:Pectinesterase n=1 Tax=Lithospermum erythrorhizon TaxID=34254 RepID=A0AAV3R1H9_LITER|nr:hypothetical protein Leryth_009176 [Lithospermum erythrorhizon]
MNDAMMDSSPFFKNSQFFKNSTKTQKISFACIIFLIFLTIFITFHFSFVSDNSNNSPAHKPTPVSALNFHPIIKRACSNTFYSSLCFSTLSSIESSEKATTLTQILHILIKNTITHVESTKFDILGHFRIQELKPYEENALQDCMEMLDQSMFELQEAKNDLYKFPTPSSFFYRSYDNLKTLLSAAMTNENSCIDGFSDLEEFDDLVLRNSHKEDLQNFLSPISRMISNCLAIVKYTENQHMKRAIINPRMLIARNRVEEFQDWVSNVDRKMMEIDAVMKPNVTVASDGCGNFTNITNAIEMAPNFSKIRYIIHVKAGNYCENVVVPRGKINIMLIGDGMGSTIITGSRSFADGFSTFASATLTVIGDKFIARDLSIVNTAGPQKYQAVALRVTSNSAFYHCEIISYQDTLYVHSFRQYYRNCTIKGTIDFIFGNAAAIFQDCLILVRKPILGQNNMITAQSRADPNQNTGISLQNSVIKADEDFNAMDRNNISTFLGRPWRNYSRTIIMNSYLDDLIHPRGWCRWNQYSTLDTVDYVEYMNTGPGSNTGSRITWGGYKNNGSEDIARRFSIGTFLRGADKWLQNTVLPLFNSSI